MKKQPTREQILKEIMDLGLTKEETEELMKNLEKGFCEKIRETIKQENAKLRTRPVKKMTSKSLLKKHMERAGR